MSLPDVDSLKSYLKIEHTAEDALLASLRAEALGKIQTFIGCPVVADERVFFDEAETNAEQAPRSLLIPETPVDVDTLVVKDKDDATISAALLRTDPSSGIIRYRDGLTRFTNGPYEITVEVGLDTLGNYDAEIEPIVSSALRDVVADLYRRRNPAASSETSAGTSVAYHDSGLPLRVAESLLEIKRPL